MKILYFILLFGVSSCDTSNSVHITKTEPYNDYYFLYGLKDQDTILYIVKSDVYERCCNKLPLIIKNKELRQVEYLYLQNDTVSFTYTIRDVNNRLIIKTGAGKPGEHTMLNSFRQLPYIIDDCNIIRCSK